MATTNECFSITPFNCFRVWFEWTRIKMEIKIDQEVRLRKRIVALRRHCEHKTKQFPRKSGHINQADTKVLLQWREREVLVGITSGASDEEIADKLNISLTEVKADINSIYKKLNAPNRLQAVLWAAAHL